MSFSYSTVAKLLAWIFPTKEDRHLFRKFCHEIDAKKRIKEVAKNYPIVLKNIKNGEKQRVLFLVSEIAKWKMQSIYDLMAKSELFEPMIILVVSDIQTRLSKEKQAEFLKENYNFFKEKDMTVDFAFDFKKCTSIGLEKFNSKIVFYQQPWQLYKEHSPYVVSKYALTFYVPYYVPNYGKLSMDCEHEFHRSLFRYYVLNKDWEYTYKADIDDYTGDIIGLGHPALDSFYLNKNVEMEKNYVIYAPHWSFSHKKNTNPENYGTFNVNGVEILKYAKEHPEINWAFKPHPTLKRTLIKTGIMTEKEVEEYYLEWEKFANCCYTSDYIDLFLDSKALITDCGSFLIEYFCTGKPIIHLISKDCKIKPLLPSKRIFDTFYKAENIDSVFSHLETLLVKNNDYLKDSREKLLKESGLLNNYAAKNIIDDVEKIIKGN